MDLIDGSTQTRWSLEVGGLSREDLRGRLDAHGILRNAHAETLLADPVFDGPPAERREIVERSVADLGLPHGGTLAAVFARAADHGLELCPPVAAPYLRLATLRQASAPDVILRAGRGPTAALHVASAPLRRDDDYPKGFYLRVVDGQPWLRGYRCDDAYELAPEDTMAFALAVAAGPNS